MKLILPPRERIITTTIYDNCPTKYRSRIPLVRYAHLKKFVLAVKMLEGEKFERILDVGCGCGIMIPTLQKVCKRVFGLDLFTNLCAVKDKIDGNFVKADVCRMPFKSEQFDCIICLSVLEHVSNLAGALGEIKRCLSPGGRVIFGIPPSNFLTRVWLRLDKRRLSRKARAKLRKYRLHRQMDSNKICKKIGENFNIERAVRAKFIPYTVIKCRRR
jgi:ubiquinone/menaquinone biosynthesis C-methylase UbiE